MAMPPGVWELGVELWDEADRGRGYGREACALLAAHLFEAQGAIRVQATTDVDNAAMRRTLETLGFGYEGVLRGFMPQPEGGPRDYAMYAMTDEDHRTITERSGAPWTRTS
jgi:RimJ/RimL family protein N-acetyltransferase